MQNPRLAATMRDMGAKTPVALTPDYFFDYVAEFPTIAPGATALIPVRIDSNVFFITEQINSSFQLVAALNQAVAGTPLPRTAANTAVNNNDMPTMAHLRCAISTTDRPWTNISTGVRMDLLSGTGADGGWLPFKAAVAGGDVINVAVTNNAAVAVQGQVVFRGHKLPLNVA